ENVRRIASYPLRARFLPLPRRTASALPYFLPGYLGTRLLCRIPRVAGEGHNNKGICAMTSAKPRPPLIPGEVRAYPVLPLRDIVVFPHMIVPLFVGHEKSIKPLQQVMRSDTFVLLATQMNASDEDRAMAPTYDTGTRASVLQLLKLADGTVKVLVEGAARARVKGYTDRTEDFEAKAVVLGDDSGEQVEAE